MAKKKSMETIRVGIVEDQKTINESLVQSIDMYPSLDLAFKAFSAEEALEKLSALEIAPDVILLDIGLPGMTGLEALPQIKKSLEKTDIIMLTTYEESEKIFSALSSGACSYISKRSSLKVIMDAIFTVYRGGSFMSPTIARRIAEHFAPIQSKNNSSLDKMLTARQMQVVEGISSGNSYKMIAADLDISLNAVRSHIKKIYKTLEINSKIELINIYRKEDNI